MAWPYIPKLCAYLLVLSCVAGAESIPAGIDKMKAYEGTWKITIVSYNTEFSKAGTDTSTLRNECWLSAAFFVCNQFVNGDSKVLIIFTYDAKQKIYNTYNVAAQSGPGGSGKLLIDGNTWTFPWEDNEDGKTIYFRVVNVFTAPDSIEYRKEFSRDKVQWTLMARGSEKKLNPH